MNLTAGAGDCFNNIAASLDEYSKALTAVAAKDDQITMPMWEANNRGGEKSDNPVAVLTSLAQGLENHLKTLHKALSTIHERCGKGAEKSHSSGNKRDRVSNGSSGDSDSVREYQQEVELDLLNAATIVFSTLNVCGRESVSNVKKMKV